jgi:hypothetical protein
MAYWEFLLQKEGDRSWLPLESPDVEILEGRYRVVARSNRVNTTLEVRVIHQTDDEASPKRRCQKRAAQTNQDGLVVVLPFTQLQSGIWELRCASDVMADMMGEGWQHTVQLFVQPHGSVLDDDDWVTALEAELNEETVAAADVLSEPEVSMPPATPTPAPMAPTEGEDREIEAEPEIGEPEIASPVAEAGDSSGHLTTEEAPASASAGAAEEAFDTSDETHRPPPDQPPTVPADLAIYIHLDQDSYTNTPEHPLILTGTLVRRRSPQSDGSQSESHELAHTEQIEVNQAEAHPETAIALPPGYIQTLEVRLLNPQTGEVQAEQAIALEVLTLPFTFECALDIPPPADTHLWIGQVMVRGAASEASLAQQTFSITTDLDSLLRAIAEDSLGEVLGEAGDLTSPFGSATPPDLTLLNLITTPPPEAAFQSKASDPLPPQLYDPDELDEAEDAPRRTLDLPNFAAPFGNPDPEESPEAELESDVSEDAWADDSLTDSLAADWLDSTETVSETTSPELQESLDAAPVLEDVSPQSEESPLAEESLSAATAEQDGVGDDASAATLALDPFPSDRELDQTEPAPVEPVDLDQTEPDQAERPGAIALDGVESAPAIEPLQESLASAHFPPPVGVVPRPVTSPTDLDFLSLNLQDRFLARLSALAADAELQNWLRSQSPSAAQSTGQHTAPTSLDADLSSREFVIEDDPEPSVRRPQTATRAPAPQLPTGLTLPDHEPIPTPDLRLPNGDLVSGNTLSIRVLLPRVRSRLSVKLWLQDPQTRDILDGPYWVTAFSPNGHDQLEAGFQVMVPFGCLEMQVEAIAVEGATQRESRKTSVHCSVQPPDLSTSPLDELDL